MATAGAERKTGQRQAILKAFEQADRPLSPPEVLRLAKVQARGQAKGLGIATIYRNLKSLAAKGLLKSVRLPGQMAARYELHGKAHHHHFHCRLCHQVYEVEGCPGNIEPLVPSGFTLEDHEVVLYGRCFACNGKATRASRRLGDSRPQGEGRGERAKTRQTRGHGDAERG